MNAGIRSHLTVFLIVKMHGIFAAIRHHYYAMSSLLQGVCIIPWHPSSSPGGMAILSCYCLLPPNLRTPGKFESQNCDFRLVSAQRLESHHQSTWKKTPYDQPSNEPVNLGIASVVKKRKGSSSTTTRAVRVLWRVE